ncbi:MAG: TIGR04283 family arsenosugar biosynthesis glycosyltransferase [Saprospiraceae bacterium]|jgi:rSAM/selenodomain-associated transferase 2|nr:TIGR04283 family arsenosugar biosynthesis glycosyltransferase [Saprospiraceae bacterium]MBX7163174.1 TIGR04283 family arsenosugar biosynthesis glycosyltransferase [Saprospiraceae bacterium]
MRLSIVIPVLNEEKYLGTTLRYLKENCSPLTEIIVVDGGSQDNTSSIVKDTGGCVWIETRPQRAGQMNKGAALASGEILFFLHADTLPPKALEPILQNAIQQSKLCGCFISEFQGHSVMRKLNHWFTKSNLLWFRGGDQSCFVEKKLFHKIGGFDERYDVMEDYDIICRLKKQAPFSILPHSISISDRKIRRHGYFKINLIYSIMLSAFILNVGPKKLYQLYKTLWRSDSLK